MKTENILNKIIQLALLNEDIAIIWLYGSRARGTNTEESDFDLAIAFKSFLTDPFDSRMRPELLAMDWQQVLKEEISIIDINKAPLPLAYTVILDNNAFYVIDELRQANEEQRIMSRWELDYEYSRKHFS